MTNNSDIVYKYAFLDSNNKVIYVCVFGEETPDSNLLEDIKEKFSAVSIMSCVNFPNVENNMYWREDKNNFTPSKGFDSWIWDEEAWAWVAPIPEPIIQEGQVNFWNENTKNWDTLNINN